MQRGWDGPEALAGLMSQSLHIASHAPPHAKAYQPADQQAWHLQQQHAMMALPHGGALPPELAHLAAAGAAPYRPAAAGAPGGVALANGYTAAPAAPQSVGWGGQSIPENGTFKVSADGGGRRARGGQPGTWHVVPQRAPHLATCRLLTAAVSSLRAGPLVRQVAGAGAGSGAWPRPRPRRPPGRRAHRPAPPRPAPRRRQRPRRARRGAGP